MRSLLQAWSRLEKDRSDVRVVAVTTRPPGADRNWCPRGYTGTMVADPTAKWHRRFHATWWPRVYLQDSDGRLAYAQPPEHLEKETEVAVVRQLSGRISVAARDISPGR